jgi:hypothetical protein
MCPFPSGLRPTCRSNLRACRCLCLLPPVACSTRTSVIGLISTVLLEIIKYEGLSVSQYGQRLITPDGVEGAFDARPPTYVPLKPTKLSVCDDTKGTFGARPLAYIPNKCRIHVIMTD